MQNSNASINRRILIIDDNSAIHEDYRKILCGEVLDSSLDDLAFEIFGESETRTSHTVQYEMDSAYQGQEGLAMVQQSITRGKPYAMAFVDMRMPPGWDGLETIVHLWKADPNLNVVICSAYSDYQWADVVDKLGTSDRWLILKKPFDNAEVCQLAAALTEKRRLAEMVQERVSGLENEVALRTADVREREERLKAILDTAPDGIVTLCEEGKIQSINAAASLLFGVSHEHAVGSSLAIFFSDESDAQELLKLVQSEKPIEHSSIDCSSQHSDGTVFPSQWTIGQFDHESKRCFTAIVRDESERDLLRCELTQAQKLEAVGQLAAGIAHEINTPAHFVGENIRFLEDAFADLDSTFAPLQVLLDACSSSELAKEETTAVRNAIKEADLEYLSAEIPKTISQTLNGIERITKIVRAMKEFSHPGSSVKVMRNIHDSLESTITVAQNEWKYVAEIKREYDQNLPLVPCLIAELNQVLINLLVNAAHAVGDVAKKTNGKLGTITIGTKAHADHAEIYLSDTGTGIPKAIQNRVFDPFFTTKEVGKGTGQGLAIARSIVVDKHKGRLELESVEGKGSTFRIRLPLELEEPSDETTNALAVLEKSHE